MTVDGWLRARQDQAKDQFFQAALQKGVEKGKALEEANRRSEEFIHNLKTKLVATSDRLNTSTAEVNE
jgi:hypothetical protein